MSGVLACVYDLAAYWCHTRHQLAAGDRRGYALPVVGTAVFNMQLREKVWEEEMQRSVARHSSGAMQHALSDITQVRTEALTDSRDSVCVRE